MKEQNRPIKLCPITMINAKEIGIHLARVRVASDTDVNAPESAIIEIKIFHSAYALGISVHRPAR